MEGFGQLSSADRVALRWFPKGSGSRCPADESLALLSGRPGDGSGAALPSPSVILSHTGGSGKKKPEVATDWKVEVNGRRELKAEEGTDGRIDGNMVLLEVTWGAGGIFRFLVCFYPQS